MKEILIAAIVGILTCSSTLAQHSNSTIKYFDENNIEISESEYYQILSTKDVLELPIDSANHKKLTLRENRGRIPDRASLESLLEKAIHRELDAEKPIVIIYHPCKDACNSGGTATKESYRIWFNKLEAKVFKIAQAKPVYIYKDNSGLENYEGVLTWYKDPESTIEKRFFKYHYPCSSFVVISKTGDYISYFGEFADKDVWKATRLMNN